MRHLCFSILFLILITGCNEEPDFADDVRLLTLDDIKQEYYTADSLNRLEDRSNIDSSTITLGVDKRNGKVVIRTCGTRSFGCLLFTDYYTIKYQDCDSICCEKNGGIWLVDYAGFAGTRSVVGCVPDTIQ
jgi:hypothetical protein